MPKTTKDALAALTSLTAAVEAAQQKLEDAELLYEEASLKEAQQERNYRIAADTCARAWMRRKAAEDMLAECRLAMYRALNEVADNL